ncbi:hypothetical protein V1525DRAFT_399186 [Lipomyces kononenkoae]|uniref:Uncharacterized protein n=1 Tax=Lipomyces kononenkoae TaxID=34357 RepID=A0ACC3T585_LIPKO
MSDKPSDEISPTASQPPQFELERELLQRFIHLHRSQPHHEIFGDVTKGRLRLPLYSSQRNGQSWASICRRIALKVTNEMGSSFGPNDCWLSRTPRFGIFYGNRQERLVQIFRLLYFLADPTPHNWASLSINGYAVKDRCSCMVQQNNGHRAYCINAIYHGGDGSRTINTFSQAIVPSTQPLPLISPIMPHSVRLDLVQLLLAFYRSAHH